MQMQPLRGRVAVVAGATRGAGRGIATALGEAGAIVYCSGRSTRGAGATPGRPETIEETAELVTRAGGTGIAQRTDHTVEAEVEALFARVRAEQSRLDILVNDVWGGDELTEFGKSFWELTTRQGFHHARSRCARSHPHESPRSAADDRAQFRLDRGDHGWRQVGYRGNLFYDLAKTTAIRLAFAMAHDLDGRSITALAVTPGFLRSEAMLDRFGVSEANWRDAVAQDSFFAESETPLYVGRAVAALAADPNVHVKRRQSLGELDVDARVRLHGRRREAARLEHVFHGNDPRARDARRAVHRIRAVPAACSCAQHRIRARLGRGARAIARCGSGLS